MPKPPRDTQFDFTHPTLGDCKFFANSFYRVYFHTADGQQLSLSKDWREAEVAEAPRLEVAAPAKPAAPAA